MKKNPLLLFLALLTAVPASADTFTNYEHKFVDQGCYMFKRAEEDAFAVTHHKSKWDDINYQYKGFVTIPTEAWGETYGEKPVTAIAPGTFYNCSELTGVSIHSGINYVGYNCFQGTPIYDNEANWDGDVLYVGDCLIVVWISNSVTNIGSYSFYGCTNLKWVYNFSNLEITKGDKSNGYAGGAQSEISEFSEFSEAFGLLASA